MTFVHLEAGIHAIQIDYLFSITACDINFCCFRSVYYSMKQPDQHCFEAMKMTLNA